MFSSLFNDFFLKMRKRFQKKIPFHLHLVGPFVSRNSNGLSLSYDRGYPGEGVSRLRGCPGPG